MLLTRLKFVRLCLRIHNGSPFAARGQWPDGFRAADFLEALLLMSQTHREVVPVPSAQIDFDA